MIKTAMVGSAESGGIWKIDVIEYESALWLVPEWLHNTDEGWISPVRIIRMSGLAYQEMSTGRPADYVLTSPIPKSVLDGGSPEDTQYQVIERPDIRVRSGGTH